MRRLLIVVVTLAVTLGITAPALASNRVPGGVKRIAVILTYPPRVDGSRRPIRRTLTRLATVRRVIRAVDALQGAQLRGVCPMIMILGPKLTVVFKGGGTAGYPTLAEAEVDVMLGTHGSSGSTACFPIHFSSRGLQTALVGNSFVRLMGGLIGTPIS
jgi:hypothetical protein